MKVLRIRGQVARWRLEPQWLAMNRKHVLGRIDCSRSKTCASFLPASRGQPLPRKFAEWFADSAFVEGKLAPFPLCALGVSFAELSR